MGLGGFFDFVLLAQECGFVKPGRRIFDLALAECGCGPEQVVHVGDSLPSDILGANGMGIRSMWLNRDGATNDTGITPHHEISDLRELLEIL